MVEFLERIDTPPYIVLEEYTLGVLPAYLVVLVLQVLEGLEALTVRDICIGLAVLLAYARAGIWKGEDGVSFSSYVGKEEKTDHVPRNRAKYVGMYSFLETLGAFDFSTFLADRVPVLSTSGLGAMIVAHVSFRTK